MLCNLVTAYEYLPVCGACVSHLAARAEGEDVPAGWGEVARVYGLALEAYPSPVFPTVAALVEADRLAEGWVSLSRDIDHAEFLRGDG